MLDPKDYQIMKYAVEDHGNDFWLAIFNGTPEGKLWCLEDLEKALDRDGYELVLLKKE